MVVGAGKATDATEAVAVEVVSMVEEDMVGIHIVPTTHVMLLKPDIFLGI